MMIFFWDRSPLSRNDTDVKALLRISVLLQHSDCVQPRDSRFPDLFLAHEFGI